MRQLKTSAMGLGLLLLCTRAAAAAQDDKERAAPEPARAPASDSSRVRASHRVDVIAPGERIDTILDRMRAGRPPSQPEAARPPPAAETRQAERLPLRGPDKARDLDRASPDAQRGPGARGSAARGGASQDRHHK